MFLTGVVPTSGSCDMGMVLSNVPDWGCTYLWKVWCGNGIEQCSWLGLYLPVEAVIWERYWAMFLTAWLGLNLPLEGVTWEWYCAMFLTAWLGLNLPLEGVTWERYWAMFLTGVVPTSGRCDVGTVLSNIPDWGCTYLWKVWRGNGIEQCSWLGLWKVWCESGIKQCSWLGLYLPQEAVTWEWYWAMFLTGVVPTSGRCDVGTVLSNVPDWGCINLWKVWCGNGIEQYSWLGLYLPLEGVMWERYWAIFLTGVVPTSGSCDMGTVLSNVPNWGCIYLWKVWCRSGIEQCSWLGLNLPLEGVTWERYWAMFLTGVVPTSGRCDVETVLSNIPDWGCTYLWKVWCGNGIKQCSWLRLYLTLEGVMWERYWAIFLTGVVPTSGRCDVGTVLSNVPDWGCIYLWKV